MKRLDLFSISISARRQFIKKVVLLKLPIFSCQKDTVYVKGVMR